MTVETLGIKLRLDFSFFAVLTLMLLLSDKTITVMCFVSSILHEAGHIAFMFAFSCKPSVIEFSAFGLRIRRDSEMLVSYKRQFFIAMGGISVNLIISLVGFIVCFFTQSENLKIFVSVNVFIALTNMFPIEALDMGRGLYCLFMSRYDEARACAVLSRISDVTVIVFTFIGILYTLFISLNISLCAVCIYLILINRKRR